MASENQLLPQIPDHPLQRIALCMSGGGYRAASFQLGMLSYLNSRPYDGGTLLEKVKAISTVSGGTIIGVYYAAMVQEGQSFGTIYTNFVDWLRHEDLVKQALAKVSDKGQWTYPYKRRNIINAFAELYDQTLLGGRTMAVFHDFAKSHLDFVCFNGTEFTNGYRFRFQAGEHCSMFGSNEFRLGRDEYEQLRLGDIMAASSGFSGGFEPIAMPDDFLDPTSDLYRQIQQKYDDRVKKLYGARAPKLPIGIMDGGIHDNQGISSIESYQGYKRVQPFDLIMFSDVSSPYLSAFEYFKEKSNGIREETIDRQIQRVLGWKTRVYWIIFVVMLFGLVPLVLSKFEPSTLFGIGLAFFAFGGFGLVAWFFVTRILERKLEQALNYIGTLIPPYFRKRLAVFDIRNTRIKHLEVLLLDRLNSLKMLLPDVFLKQIRRLHYNRVYNDPTMEYRRSACLIKELTEVDFDKKYKNDYSFMKKIFPDHFGGTNQKEIVGEKILAYTNEAAQFGTTLWFTDDDAMEDTLQALIISGQVSCCQDLLIYLTRIIHTEGNGFEKLKESEQQALIALHKEILTDWLEFKKTPEKLYNELKKHVVTPLKS